jgi:fermentation-respiration switch protein FrsA (DUF1100 family)
MTSIALTILAMLAVSYAVLALTLYYMQPSFVYSPIRELPYTPAELGLNFEDVYFRTSDKLQLHGWFIPASASQGPSRSATGSADSSDDSNLTVLYCHGNGGNIMFYLDTVNLLNGLGLNCFIFDYRGFGQSQGRPSEDGTYLDARAAFRWLTKIKKIPREQIIISGWSLGGLVIDGAFTSYADIGSCYYPYMPVRLFARFDYPTIYFIRRVKCPVLIIHSREDETIPFEMGLGLYDAANEPKDFVELHGGHNDAFLTSAETYKFAWQKWLKSLQSPEQTRTTKIS